ncbi:MAG TPA: hypothetical protein VNU73_11165 [Steroidobacteraceae bacterium]|nr:hypothetical protein [Steroidobacteraceae bacterium]
MCKPGALRACLALVSVLLAACTAPPVQPVTEKLDPATGTTLIVMSDPVEMVTEQNRGASRDPFAFVAPFEVDRMGDRKLFLWLSTPEDNGPVVRADLLCGAQSLELAPTSLNLPELGISETPYRRTAPWSRIWYFQLSDAALGCLGGAARVSAVTHLENGVQERFTAEAQAVRGLAAFAAHYAAPL